MTIHFTPATYVFFAAVVPVGMPQNVLVVAHSRMIYISWNPPSAMDRNGNITGYIVSESSNNSVELNQFFTKSENFNLTSLQAFITYTLSVAAQTAVGTGPFSKAMNVTTLEDGKSAIP